MSLCYFVLHGIRVELLIAPKEVLCSRDKEGKVDPIVKETLVSQVKLPLSKWSRLDLEKGCCRVYDPSKLKKRDL
jgi:hypothetical protein